MAPGTGPILVVEDEALVALDLQRTLEDYGYEVIGVAASLGEALELAYHRPPALVLMDIRIKGAADGIQTAAVLRSRFDVKVIYLTAHGDQETRELSAWTLPAGYLVKPLRKEDLRKMVAEVLGEATQKAKADL